MLEFSISSLPTGVLDLNFCLKEKLRKAGKWQSSSIVFIFKIPSLGSKKATFAFLNKNCRLLRLVLYLSVIPSVQKRLSFRKVANILINWELCNQSHFLQQLYKMNKTLIQTPICKKMHSAFSEQQICPPAGKGQKHPARSAFCCFLVPSQLEYKAICSLSEGRIKVSFLQALLFWLIVGARSSHSSNVFHGSSRA